MTGYLLDTDISSYVIRQRPPSVAARFNQHHAQLALSVISEAELRFGARRRESAAITMAVEEYLLRVQILPWDSSAAMRYAQVRAELERRGRPIGNMDLMIAAHALATGRVLVTNNDKHFALVAGLKLENWAK